MWWRVWVRHLHGRCRRWDVEVVQEGRRRHRVGHEKRIDGGVLHNIGFGLRALGQGGQASLGNGIASIGASGDWWSQWLCWRNHRAHTRPFDSGRWHHGQQCTRSRQVGIICGCGWRWRQHIGRIGMMSLDDIRIQGQRRRDQAEIAIAILQRQLPVLSFSRKRGRRCRWGCAWLARSRRLRLRGTWCSLGLRLRLPARLCLRGRCSRWRPLSGRQSRNHGACAAVCACDKLGGVGGDTMRSEKNGYGSHIR